VNWQNVYLLLFWVVVFVYLWRTARSVEDAKLKGPRPPDDIAKLVGMAVLFAVLFAGVLIATTQTSAIARWRIADVNIPGTVAVLVSLYLVFAFGLIVVRKSEGAAPGQPFYDAAKLMGAALGYIAAMAIVLGILGYFDIAWKERIWIAAIIMAGIIAVWPIARSRMRRRTHRPASHKHAE